MTVPCSALAKPRRGAGGPRTAAGKARSARNAVRHGLASAIDPAVADALDRAEPAVMAMAHSLIGGSRAMGANASRLSSGQDPQWDKALDVAVAEFDLQRVRLAREAVLARENGDRAILRAVADLVAADADALVSMAALLEDREQVEEARVAASARSLAAFERYHLRAQARLHRARLAFEKAWLPQGAKR